MQLCTFSFLPSDFRLYHEIIVKILRSYVVEQLKLVFTLTKRLSQFNFGTEGVRFL